LIGDSNAKANLPHLFGKWVRAASISRDATILGIVGGLTVMAIGAATAVGDGGATAAAGFGMAGSAVCSAIATTSSNKQGEEKHIKKAQKEIREELRSYGIHLA
jgi:outer membrane lipoprotein SlyB